MTARGAAYITTVKVAHNTPTKVRRAPPWNAAIVTAITHPINTKSIIINPAYLT